MIDYYTGVPGSGKSYDACRSIYKKLASGGNVIANFKVHSENVVPYPGKKVGHFIYVSDEELMTNAYSWAEPDKHKKNGRDIPVKDYSYILGLINFARNFHDYFINSDGEKQYKEHQTLLVFDECHNIWNSRTWKRSDRLPWLSFFAEHRHFGFDIILMSQFDGAVDKQLKGRLENEVYHRKFFNFLKPKMLADFVSLIFPVPIFIVIVRKYGMKSKKEAHYYTRWVIGSRKIFDFYNTSTNFAFKDTEGFIGCAHLPEETVDRSRLWLEVLEEFGCADYAGNDNQG